MKYKENMISVQFIYVLQHVIPVLHQFNRPFFFHFFFSIFFLFFSFPPFFSSDSWKKISGSPLIPLKKIRVPPSFRKNNSAFPPKFYHSPGVNNDRSLSAMAALVRFLFGMNPLSQTCH